jgi:hypothetical protein
VRRLLSLLIVGLVLARGAIPAGFMPVASNDGSLEIIICSEHGAQSIVIGQNDKPANPEDAVKAHKGLCPFAATALAALAPQTLTVTQPYAIAGESKLHAATSAVVARFASGASARSPPFPQA